MSTLVERAEALGGRAAYPIESAAIVLVPAERAVSFCREEFERGNAVDFFECLYHFPAGRVQPSMELSADLEDFRDNRDYLASLEKSAATALSHASELKAAAFFEIGVTIKSQ